MKCDLCGKKNKDNDVRSYEAVAGSKLCVTCFTKVSDTDDDSIKCACCNKAVLIFFRVDGDVVCNQCYEKNEETLGQKETTRIEHDFDANNGLPTISASSGFGWISVALMIFGIFFQLATLIGFAVPLCILINIITLATAFGSGSILSKMVIAVSGAQLFLNFFY